jgi:hypothetical protein
MRYWWLIFWSRRRPFTDQLPDKVISIPFSAIPRFSFELLHSSLPLRRMRTCSFRSLEEVCFWSLSIQSSTHTFRLFYSQSSVLPASYMKFKDASLVLLIDTVFEAFQWFCL